MEISHGFYTALGTPIDESGAVIEASLIDQINMQIAADASGLLLLGSMGMEPCIVGGECARAAKLASGAVNGRVPLFVGVMDNSVRGIIERIDSLKGLKVDGAVLTAPYYFTTDMGTLVSYFTAIADHSHIPIYLYDLPVATKHKLSYAAVKELSAHRNIAGIKTADLPMILRLIAECGSDFITYYSDLEYVDIGWTAGSKRFLDGMFACAPANSKKLASALKSGDMRAAAMYLKNIVDMRVVMARFDVFPSFTYLMNLLGLSGRFAPDYTRTVSGEAEEILKAKFSEIGEI